MLFIPGLVMVCESTATDDITKKGLLIAIGAIFMAAGFFITPIAAVHAGEIRKRYNLVQAVVSCKLYTIGELSMKLQMDCHDVSDLLNICICKGYLSEYIRQNDTLVLNEHIANVATSHDYECDHCGAVVTLQQGENLVCPYCGCALPKNSK